ncbi:Protein HEADING DATE REPRESSOR 1, partial [Cucurbita argyrosperma subsp. argyrosperma]
MERNNSGDIDRILEGFSPASSPRIQWKSHRRSGKKRKLVNADIVESMRRIAILEMNRKDRKIGRLNDQLAEVARCLEYLQLQLVQEKSKR